MSAEGTAVAIRELREGDQDGWNRLWGGYLRFYRARLDPSVTLITWRRLLDPTRSPHGLVAARGDTVLGLAHYLFHVSTWSSADYCYLEDLFVSEDARGLGVGRALIGAVYDRADAAGASRVYWMTQEYNRDARALYDTLAHHTSFVQYRR